MGETEKIRHPGIVESVYPDHVMVSILATAGCASCYAKGSCSMAEMKEKQIEVPVVSGSQFHTGQHVVVEMDFATGKRAVFLGYLLPFLILMVVMVATYTISGKDGLAGLLGLASLLPYYFTLYYFRDKLKKQTVFRLVVMD